jgi:hypothetical protein
MLLPGWSNKHSCVAPSADQGCRPRTCHQNADCRLGVQSSGSGTKNAVVQHIAGGYGCGPPQRSSKRARQHIGHQCRACSQRSAQRPTLV